MNSTDSVALTNSISTANILTITAPQIVSFNVVQVSRHVFDVEEDTLATMVGLRPTLFVVDRRVFSLYGAAIRRYAKKHLNCLSVMLVDGSEARKSFDQVAEVCTEAIRCGLGRDGVIVAVGGGVAMDVSGLAASLFRRGIRFIRIPTTLVGLIDVCVGIKHAINFASKKNVLGAFYPPLGGINDISFLQTLPQRQLACGVAEIVKMGVVCDALLLDLLEQHEEELMISNFATPPNAAEHIVLRAAQAMVDELQPNLFEHDLRRLVDFGHTFSPTLETTSHYKIAHGEAVGIDMLISTAIAEQLGICDPSILERLICLCRRAGLPLWHDMLEPRLLSRALEDARQHRGGNLNLVVPVSMGHGSFIQHVDLADLEAALVALRSRLQASGLTRVGTNNSR